MFAAVVSISTVVSTLIGGAQLYGQFRRVDSFRNLRDSLQRASDAKAGPLSKAEEHALLQWLEHSQAIIEPLKTRLGSRFILSLAAIFGLAFAGWGFDTLTPSSSSRTTITLGALLGALQVGAALLNRTGVLLQKYEVDFLRHANSLYAWFYDVYVIPAIVRFNDHVDNDPLLKGAKWGSKAEGKRIANAISEELQRLKGPEQKAKQ
jgi:hypothetical protein